MRNSKGFSALCVFLSALLLAALFAVPAFADVSSEAGGTTILSLDFTDSGLTTSSAKVQGMQLGGNIKYGGLTLGKSLDGNEYYKFFVDDTNVGTTPTDPFGGFYFSNRNNSKADGALQNFSYLTVDLDVSTDDSFIQNMSFFLCARNASGGLTQTNSSLIKTVKGTDGEWYFTNNNGKKTYKAGGVGEWNHLSFIVMVDHSAYSKSKVLVYINGEFFETYTGFLGDATYYLDTFRWGVPATSVVNHVSLCFDNVLIRGFAPGYDGPVASIVTEAPASLAGNKDSIYYTPYEVPVKPVASADGKSYSSFAEAYEKADPLATIKLYEAIEEEQTINRELLVDTCGLSFAYSTELTVTKFGEKEELLLFTNGEPTMRVTVKLPFSESTATYTFGDRVRLPEEFSEVFARDGVRYDFLNFSCSDGNTYLTDLGEATLVRLHEDLVFTADYATAAILFETVSDGVTAFHTDFSDLSLSLFRENGETALKFYADYSAECGIYLPTDSSETFDLNGHTLSSVGTVPLFILARGCSLALNNSSDGESLLSSESTLFYLYGDADVSVESAKITLAAPTVAEGVRSESNVRFCDCTVASSGADIDSIRLDGGSLKMKNVTLIGDAEIHLNGASASAELENVKSISGLPKDALIVLTGGATANVISSTVCGNFVSEGTVGAEIASDCRTTTYSAEGYFADGSGLAGEVKEMFLASFSPRERAQIPPNEKLNGRKKNGDTPNLDLE